MESIGDDLDGAPLPAGHDRNKHAQLRRASWGPPVGKVAVMGLLQRQGDGASKVRAKKVAQRTKAILQSKVRKHVVPGSTLYTDALKSYSGLVDDRVHTNGIENFWSLFTRVIYGVHHTAWSRCTWTATWTRTPPSSTLAT